MAFTDWLSTLFISDDEVQTHRDVAAQQQAILDRQYAEGLRNPLDYWALSSDIQNAGNYEADYVAENSGFWGFLKNLPWWVFLIGAFVVIGLFIWLGGLSRVKGILKK